MAEYLLRHLMLVVSANRAQSSTHHPDHPLAVFDCVEEPSVSIRDYLKEVSRGLTSWELGMAVVLVDRLTKRCNESIGPFNAHRLMLTALIISAKMQRECRGAMGHFGRLTGHDMSDLVSMEAAFLSLLEWEVHVNRLELDNAMLLLQQSRLAVRRRKEGYVPLVPEDAITSNDQINRA